MISALLALTVAVEPAVMECRPDWAAGAFAIEAANDGDDRALSVELRDVGGRTAIVELDLPARSHKRVVLLPQLQGPVTAALVEGGARSPLSVASRSECQGIVAASLVRDDGRAGFTMPRDIAGVPFTPGELRRADLAAYWRVLEVLDVIAAEARALSELSDAEWEALARWARAGGMLVVVPGVDPGPLSRSGRLPAALSPGELPADGWQAARWGAGQVVVVADPASQDPRLGAAADTAAAVRGVWRTGTARMFASQRFQAGPAGRASRPAGMLLLGAGSLAAAIAHEVLRRRFVVGARDFQSYFKSLGIVLGLSTGLGIAAAIAARAGRETADLVIAQSSGEGLRSRAQLLGPGGRVRLAKGAWPFVDGEVRVIFGKGIAVENGGSAPAVVLERVRTDLGGAIVPVRAGAALTVRNETDKTFERGWIVERQSCVEVGELAPGEASTPGDVLRCPPLPALAVVGAWAPTGADPWYVATADGVTHLVRLEAP